MQIPQETGPQLLSTVGNDKLVCGHPAWSVSLTSIFSPNYSVCIMRSNQWPGAFTVSDGKKFENVYVGWGKKHSSNDFNQMYPPEIMVEFSKTEEICELMDPTVEQEEEARMLENEANKSADEIENVEEEEY